MKTLLILTCFLFTVEVEYSSSWENILSELNIAVNEEKWERATELFRQAIKMDIAKTDNYYQTSINKHSIIGPVMAKLLANHYMESRDYHKASFYYKEITEYFPDDISSWVNYAEVEMLRGNEEMTLVIYKNILEKKPENLSANIFMGNYCYLNAENERMKIENKYKKIASTGKKENTEYKEELIRVFETHYVEAEKYLKVVLKQFSSMEAERTLERINLLEKEIRK